MAIILNGYPLDTSARFPDGTFAFRIPPLHSDHPSPVIKWKYEGEQEAMALYYLVHHLRRHQQDRPIHLILPYIPNARMDRTRNEDEVFTLKYFANFINSLRFNEVIVYDPHSSVAVSLLDRVLVCSAKPFIESAIDDIRSQVGEEPLLFYPDEGAVKRYADVLGRPYNFGVKFRDWRSGMLQKLQIMSSVCYSGKTILIVDDICCRGGTFLHAAKELKEAGAARVFVYCTHCESAIFDGELLKTDYVDGVYTTSSVFQGSHPKIRVFLTTDPGHLSAGHSVPHPKNDEKKRPMCRQAETHP